MAEKGEEYINMDNNTAEPGETRNDSNKAKPAPGIRQAPLTSQTVDTSSEIIDHAEDFDNRTEMTTDVNPLNKALLLGYQEQAENKRWFEPEGLQVECSTSTSSYPEFQSSHLSRRHIDPTLQSNNSAEPAEQAHLMHDDSDHVDPTDVVLSMTELSISEGPTEPDVGQSEDSATGDVQTHPKPPQSADEHTAPTTLTEKAPHAPFHLGILPANEESLLATRKRSDSSRSLTQPEDKSDWDLPTEPIQPESLLSIDDRGSLQIYDHKIEWHAEGIPESEQICQMIEKLIRTFHAQPSYREELKKMLGDAQTDNTWPAILDNIDVTIPPGATDYFEDFKLDLVNLGEMHLSSSKEEAQNALSLLCTNHVSLSTGCLTGKLSFPNKSFGSFLANFVSGKLSIDLKRALFSETFFRSIKCPPNLKIGGIGEISLEELRLAERVLKMLIKQHLRIQVSVPYKYIFMCISKGGLGELPINISAVPIEQPETDKSLLIKKLRTELDVDVELKGVFSLCYPDPDALENDFNVFDKSQYTSNEKLEKFFECGAGCAELKARLKLLPCQHKVCGTCLPSIMKKDSPEKRCSRCDREYEKEVHKLVIRCPLCSKEHDVSGVFEDCQHSLAIADVIDHPTYKQLKATRPKQQPKKQDIRSSENLFVDNKPEPLDVKSNSESSDMAAQKNMLREAFGIISNVSKNLLLDRIFIGDFVELKDKEVRIGERKEVGVVTYVDDYTDKVEVIFPSVSGWHGNISDLILSSDSSDLPVKGDVVNFIDDTNPEKPVHGTGILSGWPKFSDEDSAERSCEIQVLVENSVPIKKDGQVFPTISVSYRNIKQESSLQIGERVLVRNEINNEYEKGTIIGLDTETDSVVIQLWESGEEILARYNNVARDRPLQAGDFVMINGAGQSCIKGSNNAGGVVWARDGECGRVVRRILTSSDYCDEVEVELFRLPYLPWIFSCKNMIQINRRKAYSEKMKYDRIFNELFFLDRPSLPTEITRDAYPQLASMSQKRTKAE